MPEAPAIVCPYCLTGFGEQDQKVTCPQCHSVYHEECWTENGGCAVYGCTLVPKVEGRSALEVPVSYWGQENKPCPNCGKEILAAALRCRHCGATFATARPVDSKEFLSKVAVNASLPAARRTIIWIFVLSVVPFLSPIGAIWGAWWQRSNRETVQELPALYGALVKIGLVVSIAMTAGIVLLSGLYVAVRGH